VALSYRENYIRNATFSGPEYIPCNVAILPATWKKLREELEDVLARHPVLFPNFRRGARDFDAIDERHRAGTFTDPWGCVWHNAAEGIVGIPTEAPLASWEALESYRPPDPARFDHFGPINWEQRLRAIRQAKERGQLAVGHVAHGFMFMRLYYLRGFENFMLDVAADEPRLQRLVNMVERFNQYYVQQYLSVGVDMVSFGDDLGTQRASMLSPKQFAKWIAPSYTRLMKPLRDAGILVYLHSDGHIMEIADQLINCGVCILNLQDMVNGLENIERELKGRICIRLDLDRQYTIPFGTRKEIRQLIEEAVRRLGSPRGGLELQLELSPSVPPENADAALSAIEEFRTYWWDGRGG